MGIEALELLLALMYVVKEKMSLEEIHHRFSPTLQTSQTETTALLKKLAADGYLIEERDNGTTYFAISFEGVAFLEGSPKGFVGRPYSFGQKKQMQKYSWSKAKTMAAIANALIIIAVAIWAVLVSDKSNKYEAQIKTLEDSIQKLNLRAK